MPALWKVLPDVGSVEDYPDLSADAAAVAEFDAAPEPRRLQNGLALAAVAAGLDQTSKWAIMHILDLETLRRVEILPFLDFALFELWHQLRAFQFRQ